MQGGRVTFQGCARAKGNEGNAVGDAGADNGADIFQTVIAIAAGSRQQNKIGRHQRPIGFPLTMAMEFVGIGNDRDQGREILEELSVIALGSMGSRIHVHASMMTAMPWSLRCFMRIAESISYCHKSRLTRTTSYFATLHGSRRLAT
jgi:hypothetical protein